MYFSHSVKEHLDFKSPVGPHMQLPYCHNDFEQSKKTLSHLTVSIPLLLLAKPRTDIANWTQLTLHSDTLSFALQALGVWEIYALENAAFYIAVYGPYKPYISHIHNTGCSNAPEINCRVGMYPIVQNLLQ